MEGEWAGGPSPPPRGQLTRCFSAVAELLVLHRFSIVPLQLHDNFVSDRCPDWLPFHAVFSAHLVHRTLADDEVSAYL